MLGPVHFLVDSCTGTGTALERNVFDVYTRSGRKNGGAYDVKVITIATPLVAYTHPGGFRMPRSLNGLVSHN